MLQLAALRSIQPGLLLPEPYVLVSAACLLAASLQIVVFFCMHTSLLERVLF